MEPYKENIGPKILLKNHQNNLLRVRVKNLSFSWPNQVRFWNEQLNALNRPKHIFLYLEGLWQEIDQILLTRKFHDQT